MKQPKKLVYVLYDSVQNSVFEGQVVAPLLKALASKTYDTVTIVSFERTPVKIPDIILKNKEKVHLELLPRGDFLSTYFFFGLRKKFASLIDQIKPKTIIARGPLAGLIAAPYSLEKNIPLTIQIRGLLAEEYRYTHKNAYSVFYPFHAFRWYQYKTAEKRAYEFANNYTHIHLEAVSSWLRSHLITHFGITPTKICIAQYDIPFALRATEKKEWRKEVRTFLDIPDSAYLWCYNGSAKAWQCPEKTIQFFAQQSNTDYLLILTPQKAIFEKMANSIIGIDKKRVRICSVPHEDMFRYLAACDDGIIFREPHILNWISRPTKALEYAAAGLAITHNNTVGMLATREEDQQPLQKEDSPTIRRVPPLNLTD